MFFLPILRWNLSSISAGPRCASASLTYESFHFPTTPRCVGTRFKPIPSSSASLSSSSFLLAVSRFENASRPPPPPLPPSLSLLLFPSHLHTSYIYTSTQLPRPTNSFIFLRNFNDFPSHTEVELKSNFCGPALCTTPPDPRILSFS